MAEEDYYKGYKLGHDVDRAAVMLDLFRLYSIMDASKPMADHCDRLNGCPVNHMIDNFQRDEVTRLVISISIFGRLMDDNFKQRKDLKVIEVPPPMMDWMEAAVGTLIPDNNKPQTTPLILREAFNKVIHARKMNFDVVTRKPHHKSYIRPTLYLYGDYRGKEWKATLKVRPFIEKTWELSGLG